MWKAPVSAGNNLATMPTSLLDLYSLYSGFGVFTGILLLTPLATILTIVTSWLLLRWYKKSVGKLMQTYGLVYVDAVSASHEGMLTDRLNRQLISRPWHCAGNYAIAGVCFALVMCVPYVFASSQPQINPLGASNQPLQFLLMWWIFTWPCVLTTIFIVNPAWQSKCTILFGYFVVLIAFSALVTLIPTEAASQWVKGMPAFRGETPDRVAGKWIGFNLMPTLLLITFHNRHRGREEPFQTLPSLRTVQAVLPHTALQSIVSSSGSARFRMGFIHCEKSQAREVGICPMLMVLDISSRSPSLLLILPQNTS